MRRRDEGKRARVCRAAIVLSVLAGQARFAGAEALPANARLLHPAERMAVGRAILGASHKLAGAECQGLLDEFADAEGRPLRAALEGQNLDAEAYLGRVLFYDTPPEACGGLALAGTHLVGSRVIRVCGRRFVRASTESSSHAEAVIIHEMLHALGLGENPPTSAHITSRVMDRCRR
ncbi:MAG TPA: hypothetical protein VMT87_09225 [Vicinamibacteria bacterium]|nr:hypothetical protein [Vicinamibacteria bacterium]